MGRIMACKSILLVEDDFDLRTNMASVLEMEGYEVIQAENGQIALNSLCERVPDRLPSCIILDLMMPVMDGKTFLEILVRDHPNDLAKIPIFIATAKGSPKQSLDDLPLSLDSIRKPMEIDELLAAAEKYCGKP